MILVNADLGYHYPAIGNHFSHCPLSVKLHIKLSDCLLWCLFPILRYLSERLGELPMGMPKKPAGLGIQLDPIRMGQLLKTKNGWPKRSAFEEKKWVHEAGLDRVQLSCYRIRIQTQANCLINTKYLF